MFWPILPLGVIALFGASQVLAQQANCSLAQRCPQDQPCCSQYGQCGVGAYCLGGCDPRMSFSLDSCVPEPVCESKVYPMNSMDGIVSVNDYLGDPSTAEWVYQGQPLVYDGNLLLTMPANSVGTVLATSTYMWYGNVKATLKTSRGQGVVTAFILLSDVHDEIDYEWVGSELTIAQTNYYFQGIPDYDNSGNISLSDTFANFHTYEIQWTPDNITWWVDGQLGRTKQRSDTWNASANQWNFPQTPSRVQISIWPGGASSNAPGTVQWAGGPIDWNSPDIQNYGYDFATFGQIEVQCYNATSPPGTNIGKSYTYNNLLALNNSVVDGNNPTVLASFQGTGTDMGAGNTTASSSSSVSGTATASTSASGAAESIPGGGNGNPGQDPNSGSNSGSGSGVSGSNTASSAACAATGFTQNCDSSGSGTPKSDSPRVAERTLGASAFAVVLALAGLLFL